MNENKTVYNESLYLKASLFSRLTYRFVSSQYFSFTHSSHNINFSFVSKTNKFKLAQSFIETRAQKTACSFRFVQSSARR